VVQVVLGTLECTDIDGSLLSLSLFLQDTSSQSLLKKMLEATVVRLRPKTVCKVVGKVLAQRQEAQKAQEAQESQEEAREGPRDGKMVLKGRDVHRMVAHLSSTLSNREKGELQLHLLNSMVEEDDKGEEEQGGGEGGKEGGKGTLQESSVKTAARVTAVQNQMHALGDEVREIWIARVGCTRCIPSNTDHHMKTIHVRVTWGVECIRALYFYFMCKYNDEHESLLTLFSI
jgi:hypothetical protein